MNKKSLIKIAGSVWVLAGLFLILRGWELLQRAMAEQGSAASAVYIALGIGLIVGGAKGKFVLSKSANRNKARIDDLDESTIKVHQVYSKSLYIMIGGMMLLGILLRTFNDYLGGFIVVGAIYCGIGTALIVSSLVYWKAQPSTEQA